MMAAERILIADEDDVLASTLSWLLKEQGYDVVVARNGERVLEQLGAEAPDLLMMDVGMQAASGYQLLERIGTDERWRDMPVLVLASLPVASVK